MVIRLLPKTEIDKRKSEEQRQAINEGLKVAERVDTLREIAASEETALEKYRTETLRDIQSDVNARHHEKEALEREIQELHREKKELLIPLDARWKEVTRVGTQQVHKEDSLNEKEDILSSKEEELIQRERLTVIKEGKAEDLKKLASAMFLKSQEMKTSSKEEAAEIRNKAQAELSLVEIRQFEVSKRESDATIKESQIKEKEERIEKYEAGLAHREQTLRAGWRNLESTTKTLHL